MSERRLVVNADDFGFARDVNEGIIQAHTDGILTATTLMANGREFDHAVALAKDQPGLDVGVHCVLVQGPSLARRGAELPGSVPHLLWALERRRLDPVTELRPQIERILAAGLSPVHMDTHKHTHLWPPVLRALAGLSREYKIPFVRRPFDLPLEAGDVPAGKRLLSNALSGIRHRFHRTLNEHGCRTTDHFAGFQLTGRYRSAELAKLIKGLPDGTTEFMCHPGLCTDELRGCSTRLKESREEELRALTSPVVKEALAASGVRLVRYREL